MISDIISAIVDTIQGLLAGVGLAVVDYFKSLVLVSSGTDIGGAMQYTDSLNEFGVFIFVLLGIGAAFGIVTVVFNLVRGRA